MMSTERLNAIMNGDTRAVQDKGYITLPAGWRRKHGVSKGDDVAVYEREDGTLEVIPPEETE